MQLKRLEAYGFKSFADKIELDFDKGITAIVGPNGSGKSNITDAIRWVLGEQNVRNLRGTKAEDIIFTGSASRKALGVAEVSLIFENNGELSVDFKEVVVTRRLFRSGESEFFINRSRCRLKDIYNLFADTGIGHDGMSIIGQNRIDDILNSKPEERRAFFEETAGITKYRNRKKESLRKLDDMEGNLLRVNDIIHEVELQLKPAEENAEKTQRYNALHGELKKCQLTGIHQKYEILSRQLEENNDILKAEQDKALTSETAVKTAEALRERLSKEALDKELSAQAQADKNEEVRSRLEKVGAELATLKERNEQSTVAKERILRQRAVLTESQKRVADEIVRLTEQKAKHQQDLSLADELLKKEQQKADNLKKSLEEKKANEKLAEDDHRKQQEELSEKQRKLAVLERDFEAGTQGEAERKLTIELAKKEVQTLEETASSLKLQRDEVQKKLGEALRVQQEKQGKLRTDSDACQALQREYNHLSQTLQTDENKLRFLKGMQKAYEGFGRAVKSVLTAKEPWRRGVCGAVGELLKIPAKYVTAMEVSLGGNVQNIVTEDTETAKAAIAFLKRGHLGRVTFLPLSTITLRTQSREDLQREEGVIGYANELIDVEEKYRKIADFLLARTLIVDSLDHALALAKKTGYRHRIVTLEGELLSPGGSLSGGSRQQREASFLNRSGEIAELEKQLENLKEQLGLSQKKKSEAEAALKDLQDDLDAALHEIQEIQVQKAELRVATEKNEENLQKKRDEVKALQDAEENLKKSFDGIKKEYDVLSEQLKNDETTVLSKESELLKLREEISNLEQDAAELTSYLNDRKVQRAVLKQSLEHCGDNILLEERNQMQSKEALARNLQEEEALLQGLAQSRQRKEELQKEDTELKARYADGKELQDRLYTERMEKLTECQKQERVVKDIGQKLNIVKEKIHRLEMAGSKTSYAMEECEEKLLSEYGITPERAAELAEDLPMEEVQQRVKELTHQLKAIGPVNPDAVKQYEELKKRFDFMSRQANDLTDAKENILSILKDIDDQMTKRFKEAFAQLQIYFGDIFVRLFGGGKAELKLLDEEDVLNSGVDILVQIPQKKQQNLSALSGGERALTVVALLFSFLKYKPSPFSVLDEIDAPLDEANVSRFGAFLKEFAVNTQFIVVTHRKGTMEAVDTMYGVTIEDAGVSKIISVKMDEIK